MSGATLTESPYRLREFHAFESDGTQFVYLVPSGAIFALNEIGREIIDCVREEDRTRDEMVATLGGRGYKERDIELSLTELEQSEVIFNSGENFVEKPQLPARSFPGSVSCCTSQTSAIFPAAIVTNTAATRLARPRESPSTWIHR